jgi:hypothetical protein
VRNEYRPTTNAIAIDAQRAKKSEYQTINPENQISGQCLRIEIADISAAGLSNEKERARATTPPATARND